MFMTQFFIFVLTFAALVLLILISVSTPVFKQLYFLHAEQAGGVRFGEWGWCLDDGSQCSEKALGIDWTPELTPWLTKALVVYPIVGRFWHGEAGAGTGQAIHKVQSTLSKIFDSSGLTFLALLSYIPPLFTYNHRHHRHGERIFPSPAFACLAFAAFLASLLALIFALALFVTALRRFHDLGFGAALGPNMWMSIGATVALLVVAMSSGCGCAGRGRFSRASPYLAYNV